MKKLSDYKKEVWRNLLKLFARNTKKHSQKYYYKVDEISVFNWNKVFTEQDLKYIFKVIPKTYRITHELIGALDSLQDDYIRVFGIKKQQKRLQRLKLNLAKKKLEYIKTGKKLLLNDIKIMERELNDGNSLIISQDSTIFDKNHVILQKWYGQKIDIKEVTVKEYNVILNVYEQENRAQRHSGRGGSK